MLNKELIIVRLEAIIKMLRGLKPEEFNYASTVLKWSSVDNSCGAVCCILGWYPKYFPEAGIRWVTVSDIPGVGAIGGLESAIFRYNGLQGCVVDAIMYGSGLPIMDIPCIVGAMECCTIEDAIGRIDKVIKFLKEQEDERLLEKYFSNPTI